MEETRTVQTSIRILSDQYVWTARVSVIVAAFKLPCQCSLFEVAACEGVALPHVLFLREQR